MGTEIIFVRVNGTNITFSNSGQLIMSGIDGLKLNYYGTIKEFPDLKDKLDWKDEAIKRFKEKISKMKNEDEIANYIIMDLKNHGYEPKIKQKAGFRREVIHG